MITSHILRGGISLSIVGLIKFSDFKDNHFEQLKNGQVFFTSPHFFAKHGNEAQKDIEGTTGLLSEVYRFPKESQYFNKNNSNIILDSPVGVKYSVNNVELFGASYPTSESQLDKMINDGSISERMTVLVQKIKTLQHPDIIFYPQSYKKVFELSINKPVYKAKDSKIEFCNSDDDATWEISCFTAIDDSDIQNHHLSNIFLNSLLDTKNPKGSIAINNGELRPWVYIPYSCFVSHASKLKDKTKYFGYGPVKYYDKKYPFSINDVIYIPNTLLLAKKIAFQNQHEFRVILGGPSHVSAIPFENPLINFGWNQSEITYGNSLDDLRNLNFS